MPRAKKRALGAVAASVPYEPRLVEQLKDPVGAAGYLEGVIEDGDLGALAVASRQLVRAGYKTRMSCGENVGLWRALAGFGE